MDRNLGIYRSSLHNWQKYGGNYCFNKYSTIKSEIEAKIDKFNKVQHKNFYQEWDKLNKTIIQKNNEIKDCIAKRHISNDLYVVDTINNFSIRCPNRNAPTCRNSSPFQDKKSPALKRFGTAGSCTKGKDCNKETSAKREEKSILQSGVPAGDSKRLSLPRQDPKDQRPQHSTAIVPIDTNAISQAQPSTIYTAPLVAKVQASEDNVHRVSITSEQDETQKEQLAVSESSKVNVEENPPRDAFVQTLINNESETDHSSGVTDSGKNTLQGKLPGNETFDGNFLGQKHISDQFLPRNDLAVSSNIRDTSFMTAGFSLGENHSDRVSVVASTINSADSDIAHSSDANFSNSDTDNQDPPDKTFCPEGSIDNVLSSGSHCNAEKGSELITDNDNELDIFGKVINAIQDNPQIIKTSMPIGIALLLGLLFKFTPLWRVLTKKNRKKGTGIIEELNSVLQEPSIMDEERSIPFSYGAFAYST
ncbi:hypothetical protein PVBG_05583 [Plasmodium vivax Brazil I]|uniref:Variable surface protein Vir18 n=1 Tax=Plasmodium vivax (strain Brazil I) TaxID=1033975 RepID=A0A0J9SLB3_PLAV1|nr:hypothetical protein PVBG_05583 [Plasmodium vivax Brazil I]